MNEIMHGSYWYLKEQLDALSRYAGLWRERGSFHCHQVHQFPKWHKESSWEILLGMRNGTRPGHRCMWTAPRGKGWAILGWLQAWSMYKKSRGYLRPPEVVTLALSPSKQPLSWWQCHPGRGAPSCQWEYGDGGELLVGEQPAVVRPGMGTRQSLPCPCWAPGRAHIACILWNIINNSAILEVPQRCDFYEVTLLQYFKINLFILSLHRRNLCDVLPKWKWLSGIQDLCVAPLLMLWYKNYIHTQISSTLCILCAFRFSVRKCRK